MTLTAVWALARVVTFVALRNVPDPETEPAVKVPLLTVVTAVVTSECLSTDPSRSEPDFLEIVTVAELDVAVYKAAKVVFAFNVVTRFVATAPAVIASPVALATV